MLKAINLKKSYHQGELKIPVLSGLNLTVANQQTIAIVGQSGSGKSTLLSLLAGLDQPETGQVEIDGKSLSGLNQKQLALFRGHMIGIVFQQFHLIDHLSAEENVALPLEILGQPHSQKRATAALAAVGLLERAKHKPFQMSGGECQRTAIARALVTQPKLILADEPSGNLDVETGNRVMDNMFQLVADHKTTMILVTHNLELAQKCDRVYQLQHGTLVALSPSSSNQ